MSEAADIAGPLAALTARARQQTEADPFGNPVLAVALAISRQIDMGELTLPHIAALVRALRDAAFAARAARLARYVDFESRDATQARMAAFAARLVRPDPDDSPVRLADFRASVERPRIAAVFTAHPTFAHPAAVYAALAETAAGRPGTACIVSHRPPRITLAEEFAWARDAMTRGRDAIDALTAEILQAARAAWPDRWTEIQPRPVILASWVGYDTDGRTDIGWWDSFRLRLTMKRLQLERLAAQVAEYSPALHARLGTALQTVRAQLAACPAGPDAAGVQAFAHEMVRGRDAALADWAGLARDFGTAIAAAEPAAKLALAVARAGLVAHGMALAHTHVRLNASQLHNALRLRLGLEDPPADRARRRTLLAALNAALETVAPQKVDFGALLGEQASAARVMMTVAQIVKFVDAAAPVRFLIAETESGATLLAALWLARLFGVERHVEISPLFETADALEHGARVLEEALRSPAYCAYLRQHGRLCLQFGYSDSGRYVGQITASYLIERLRLKLAELLPKYGLRDVELVLFDTHGESIGRGAHPNSLRDRLCYLSPLAARARLEEAGISVRAESSFQGGDGYLLFGAPELAEATVLALAAHAFADPRGAADPIYDEPDFAADFFASAGAAMGALVEDRGYAALLGAFGPALLDSTGSRPAARQSDAGGPAAIRHPRELRAIPNNAILQQLGWCANTLQGVGDAAARMPEHFAEMREASPRFRRAMDFVAHALRHSDPDVLRAVISLIDPGSWLDRAAHEARPGSARGFVEIARRLEDLDLWAAAQAMFRRLQADHVRLRQSWPDAPAMETGEMLLHALRIALIGRIWELGTQIPEFSPRHGITREALLARILRLDVPAALALLADIFPASPDPAGARDYGEPAPPRRSSAYQAEHERIFQPMQRLFDLVHEIGTAITHHAGAFG